jgi:hypothetical protein
MVVVKFDGEQQHCPRTRKEYSYKKDLLFRTSRKDSTSELSVYFYTRQTQPHIHCILVLCGTTAYL